MLKTIIYPALALACGAACAAAPEEKAPVPSPEGAAIVAMYQAVFTAPPKKIFTESAVDAPLLGNGDLLVALGGGPGNLQFYINKNDLWVMRPDLDSRPQPLARLDLSMPGMAGASYRVEQSLSNAVTTGCFTKGDTILSLETGVVATENLLWIMLSVTGGELHGKLGLFLPHDNGKAEYPAGAQTKQRISRGIYKVPNMCDMATIRSPDGVQAVERRFDTEVLVKSGAACAARVVGAGETFTVAPGKSVLIVLAASGLANTPDFRATAVKRVTEFKAAEMDGLRTAHEAWWRGFWEKSFVEIPDKLLEQRYYLSHYGLACASRLRHFPPGIFGWNTTDTPMWNGDYHMNYNLVAPFYSLYAANHIEQAAPCNDAILDAYDNSREYCRKELGFEGILHRTAHGPKGSLAHLKAHGQKSHASYSCVPLAMTWYATYDPGFAKDAYPFVRGVAEFWENYLKFENGRYIIYGDSAHEGSGEDFNPIVSLAFVKMVMNLAIDMSAALGMDAAKHATWAHIRDHISAYPTCTVGELPPEFRPRDKTLWPLPVFRYTEKGIAWHMSNAVGIQHIFPAGGIGLDSSPALLQRARNQVRVMGRWIDFNGMNSFYAAAVRVGYDPNVVLKQLHAMQAKIGAPNGMITGNPHGMEHFSIVPNAIQEMLMQSHDGVLRLFPCWPKDQDARFGTLRARGAFLVSAELDGGEICRVSILSEKGRDLTVVNPWPGKKIRVVRNGKLAETASGDRFTLKTAVNESVQLQPE